MENGNDFSNLKELILFRFSNQEDRIKELEKELVNVRIKQAQLIIIVSAINTVVNIAAIAVFNSFFKEQTEPTKKAVAFIVRYITNNTFSYIQQYIETLLT